MAQDSTAQSGRERVDSFSLVLQFGAIIHRISRGFSIIYNQDSFFYKPPNPEDTKAYYIDQQGGEDMEFSSFRPEDVAQEFYTQLKKGRKRRFTALPENLEKIIYLRQHPKSVWEARRRYGEIFLRFQQ